jgi:hypothetical protein
MKLELDWSGSLLLNTIRQIVSLAPQPKMQSEIARRCAESIGCHLINLIIATSDMNLRGFHSVCLTICRSMEDALDCFAAVTLVPNAAEKWAEGKLKASEAAVVWDSRLQNTTLPTGDKAVDYRRNLRSYFNNFAHCSPYLTDWNLYPDISPDDKTRLSEHPDHPASLTITFHVNHENRVLPQNALRIGAYLAAHTLEFASIVEEAYEDFLEHDPEMASKLENGKMELESLLKTYYGAVYLEDRPPQLQNLTIPHSQDPELVTTIPLDIGSDEAAQHGVEPTPTLAL